MTPSIGFLQILMAVSIGIEVHSGEILVGPGQVAAPRKEEAAVRPEPVLENALRAADQIAEPRTRARTLADIAAAQARLGQAGPARATFRRVAEMIEKLGGDPYARAADLSWLARALVVAGDRNRAATTIAQILEWVPKIDSVARRGQSMQHAATQQARAGDPEGASSLFLAMNDESASVRALVLAEIAGAQARLGNLESARATMARAHGEAERAEKTPPTERSRSMRRLDPMRLARVRGLIALAEAETKAGQIDAAAATLRRARAIAGQMGQESRPTALAAIAMTQRKTGDRKAAEATLSLALKIAEGLDYREQTAESLARIAIAQADSGDRPAAKQTLVRAIQIAGPDPRADSIIPLIISMAQARVGDWEGGRRSASSLNDEMVRARHIEDLAFEEAKSGEARNALERAEAQTPALLRARALLGVVRGIIERKLPSGGN